MPRHRMIRFLAVASPERSAWRVGRASDATPGMREPRTGGVRGGTFT